MVGKIPIERFGYEAMATAFEIFICGRPHEYARQAAAAAFRELERLESELSRFIESSDIGRANQLRQGESVVIGDDALRCLLLSAEVSDATARAFDPAYASLATGSDPAANTSLFALDPASHTLTSLTPRLQLDLGAVGKGYALDVMASLLREWDITCACLQSGGSTALALDPPSGEAGWPVGLGDADQHPQPLILSGLALSGSGTAVKGDHLIDPRTARVAQRPGRAWAIASSAAIADALSTAFFVMNDSQVASYCQDHPEVGAVLATPNGLRWLGAAAALNPSQR